MVERREVEAALGARRELGKEYEPEIVEAFIERIEKRLEERKAPTPLGPEHRGAVTPLALGSIGAGVGATAIATGNGDAWLAAIAWVAIVIVNLGYAWMRR